jgi:hypothetical protein
MAIFNSYVKLPEGTILKNGPVIVMFHSKLFNLSEGKYSKHPKIQEPQVWSTPSLVNTNLDVDIVGRKYRQKLAGFMTPKVSMHFYWTKYVYICIYIYVYVVIIRIIMHQLRLRTCCLLSLAALAPTIAGTHRLKLTMSHAPGLGIDKALQRIIGEYRLINIVNNMG